jgi:hypothetical protein
VRGTADKCQVSVAPGHHPPGGQGKGRGRGPPGPTGSRAVPLVCVCALEPLAAARGLLSLLVSLACLKFYPRGEIT